MLGNADPVLRIVDGHNVQQQRILIQLNGERMSDEKNEQFIGSVIANIEYTIPVKKKDTNKVQIEQV